MEEAVKCDSFPCLSLRYFRLETHKHNFRFIWIGPVSYTECSSYVARRVFEQCALLQLRNVLFWPDGAPRIPGKRKTAPCIEILEANSYIGSTKWLPSSPLAWKPLKSSLEPIRHLPWILLQIAGPLSTWQDPCCCITDAPSSESFEMLQNRLSQIIS
ncbi:hypothetical protein AVEN_116597-1 [Araneus ventricosus]|uniref:Uncharacterized protein n=1 Tax=Araneus ventricosus TaxID=182803 RepID=A0A4Y2DFZ4_ARAVE|nr:hypothetical protein AVEN_116597-1 [Araneus ventricosus]